MLCLLAGLCLPAIAEYWPMLDLDHYSDKSKYEVKINYPDGYRDLLIPEDASDLGSIAMRYVIYNENHLAIASQRVHYIVRGLPSFLKVIPDGLTYPRTINGKEGRDTVYTTSSYLKNGTQGGLYVNYAYESRLARGINCDWRRQVRENHMRYGQNYQRACEFYVGMTATAEQLKTDIYWDKTPDEMIEKLLKTNDESFNKYYTLTKKAYQDHYIYRKAQKPEVCAPTGETYENEYLQGWQKRGEGENLGTWRKDAHSAQVTYYVLWNVKNAYTNYWFATSLYLSYRNKHEGPVSDRQHQQYYDEGEKLWKTVQSTMDKEIWQVRLETVCEEPQFNDDEARRYYENYMKEHPQEEEETEPADTTTTLVHKEDNEASEQGGSKKYTIPLLIGSVLVGGAAALRKLRKKKASKGEDGKQKDEEEEDDEVPDQLQMELYKNFGDTLVVGDAAEQVSACIIRKPKDGPEYVDERLTRQIEIAADDDYLSVQNAGMVNGWKSAYVSAPVLPGGGAPEEGVVRFRLASGEASYTNRIHFKVAQGLIVFGQDNLTMPAMYDEWMRVPFLISGISEDDLDGAPTIKVIGKERGEEFDYMSQVEWNEELQLYQAAIGDIWKDEEQLQQFQPGDFLTYYIDAEAKSKHGLTVKGRLPLYRFYMGLALQMEGSDVGCYFEEYDPVHHICPGNFIAKMDDKEVTPAYTRVWLKLYTWDEKLHRVISVDPAPKEDDELRVVAVHESQQHQVDELGLQLLAMTSTTGAPYYILQCRHGVLNAPNRINAQLQMKAAVGEQTLVFRRNVHLLSQPRPVQQGATALADWQKEQNRIRDLLEKIDREILAQGLEDRLAPLVQYIQLQLDAYYQDPSFGFDRRNVKAIQKTYHSVLEGEQGDANQHTLVACDNLQEVCWEYFKCMRTTVSDMGTFQKLFVSVATFGLFDVATCTIEVIGEMKDYVDQGGDSVLGLFYVGAKKVTKKYLTDKALEIGRSGLKNFVKSGGDIKNTWNLTKADVKNMVLKEISSVKQFGQRSNGAKDAEARNAQADKKADELLKEAKKNPAANSKYGDDAVKYGRQRAQKNLDELQKSINEFKNNPSDANLMRRNEAIIRCQQDKQTMMMLKGQSNIETVAAANNGVNFGECRKVLNNHLDKVYKATDNRVRQRLAKQMGMKPDDVKIFGATSSDKAKLLSGKSVTFDRDVTYYYIDKTTGKVTYFPQHMTESIYAQEFTQVAQLGTSTGTTGFMFNITNDASREFAKKMDQTVVEDVLHHSESYGIDLQKMLDKALQGQKLTNPEKVAEAVLYKGQERFYIADKLMKAAKEATDGQEALDLEASAISELIEGCRQQVKVFKLLDARDIARLCANGTSKIAPVLREGIAVLEKLAVKGTTDVKSAETALSALGYTFEEVTKEMYRTVLNIG